MWPDKETNIDYLNFRYLVDLIVEIAMNRELTPSTIGLYGDWGSGKSSLTLYLCEIRKSFRCTKLKNSEWFANQVGLVDAVC